MYHTRITIREQSGSLLVKTEFVFLANVKLEDYKSHIF